LQLRDYGIQLMARKGCCLMICLRDCTTGIEVAASKGQMIQTIASINDIEMIWGYSTTCAKLMAAIGEHPRE